MLKIELTSVVLDLKNQNTDPLKLLVACGKIKKRKGYSKINDQIKHKLYKWITCNPQVAQSPIFNDCLKVIYDDQT